MKFLQLTDTHLLNSKEVLNKKFAYQKLDELVKKIDILKDNEDFSKLDFIVVTGDLVYEGAADDYKLLFELFDNEFNNIPLFVTIGNHDERELFYKTVKINPSNEELYLDYDVELENYHLIFIDTSETGSHEGNLQESQINWLRSVLKVNDLPKLIFSHHPIIHHNNSFSNIDIDLKEIFSEHNIIGLFAGHIHHNSTTMEEGYLSHTADSACFGVKIESSEEYQFNNRTGYSVIEVDGTDVGIDSRLITPNITVIKNN